jgi:hypothetical protein
MKTLFAFLYTFGVTAGTASLDFHRLDPGVLFSAAAVAALFAFAINDGCRVRRPLYAGVARFPSRHPGSLGRRVNSLDLAA